MHFELAECWCTFLDGKAAAQRSISRWGAAPGQGGVPKEVLTREHPKALFDVSLLMFERGSARTEREKHEQ